MTALAQSLPPSLRVDPHFVMQMEQAQTPVSPASRDDVRLQKELKSARTMLVVGATLAVSGVIHAIALGRGQGRVCSEPGDRLLLPPILGGAVAAAGVVLTFHGGFKLAAVPGSGRVRHPISAGKRGGMVAGALGLLIISQAVLFAVTAPQWLECISS